MSISEIRNVWLRRAAATAWIAVAFVVITLMGLLVLGGVVLSGTARVARDVRDFVKFEWTSVTGMRRLFLDAWRGES